jgi:photosystem II stability/assembly factor-like uncharacterized protein
MAKKILLIAILAISLIDKSLTQDIWESLNFPDTTRIMSIAINKQGFIYVGVLWGNFSNGGVYRSLDSGNNWEFCGLYKKTILTLTIYKSCNIYAGSANDYWMPGLFKSSNNGLSWDTVPIYPYYPGAIEKILKIGNDTIFLSIWGNTGQLLRSIDNGLNWELSYESGDVAEYVGDIEITENDSIYICMNAYYYNFGGVYRSLDLGDSWEFLGLLNYTVRAIEFNQNGDLFAGSGVGLFVMYQGDNEWTSILPNINIKEIIINDDGTIFLACDNIYGVIVSYDNGGYFEFFNTGFEDPWIGDMALDSSGYLIASKYESNMLYRTINSTLITNVHEVPIKNQFIEINVFPNPTSEFIVADLPENLSVNYKMEIQLSDLTGKIYQCKYSVDKKKDLILTVSNLPVGLYILKITRNNSIYYSKFINK